MSIAAENPLGLRIPNQAAAKEGVLTRTRDAEEWIKNLPMASGTATAKMLFQALHDINRSHLPPAARVQIAELFTQPINYAINTQERKYVDTGFPLSEKSRRTALVCARLNEELAFAYKIAVRDVAMAKIGHQERRILIIALFRAVRHLADVLYQSILIYEPYPKRIWRELHNLFVFAETNKWSATKVKYQIDGETIISTLRELYLKICLFATASPFRLRQREIRALYRKLPHWVELVQMRQAAEGSDTENRFIILLKRDAPPTHANLVGKPYEKPALELDTRRLLKSLRDTFSDLPSEAGGVTSNDDRDELSKNMVRRLIQAWGSNPTRQFVRTRLNFDLQVAVGLKTVYRLIAGDSAQQPHPAAFGSEIMGDEGMEVSEISLESTFSSDLLESESGLTLLPLENRDGMFHHGQDDFGTITEREGAPAPSIWGGMQGPADGAQNPGQTKNLRTLNESAGGYCVNWAAQRTADVNIGELIGIQAPNDPSSFGIAVIRWMQNDPEAGLRIGMELIASSALAVTVSASDRRRRTPTECLLVPELKTADRPASLVAPTMSYRVGDSLHVRHGDTEQHIRLVRLLESSGAFAQFQFE